MKRTNKKGFTIVELVIVIAVIAILAAVLIPNISNLVKKANESSDIQAVRNMNTFLAAEGVTGDVNSILDVYDIFADSGYNVDSYSPLYSGRHFYYDKQYNQILYVETESGKVLFPEERKNDTVTSLQNDNHDLFSLSMTVPEPKKPAGYSHADNSITATVKNAQELAYVVNEYNKSSGKTLTLTIDGTIDLMGAQCLIDEAKGDITIQGTNSAKIKNVTASKAVSTSANNGQKLDAHYACAVLIGKVAGNKVEINDITIENANIKNVDAGNVAFLIGEVTNSAAGSGATVTISNVAIKNSTVIAHRSVGALIGFVVNGSTVNVSGASALENVNVKTVGGRSALIIGLGDGTISISKDFVINNSKLSIYENAASKQNIVNGKTPENRPEEVSENVWNDRFILDDQDSYIYSVKTFTDGEATAWSLYGFNADALMLRETGDTKTNRKVEIYTTVESMESIK